MQVTVSEKMKEWVTGYIRSHRKEGTISVHVVYSKFNEDFRATFKADPQVAIRLMEASGFLKGCPSKGGYSIWLTEDAGKGKGRPYRSRTSRVNGAAASATTETKSAMPIEEKQETGEIEMKTNIKTKDDISIEPHYAFEKIPHPKTGQIDVLELIRHIMKQFDESLPNKPDMDGGYSVIKMQIYDALGNASIPSGSRPELSRIMQEMGLIKCYGKSQWGVLHNKAANYFVTARSYLVAKEATMERRKRNQKIARLENKVKKLEVPTAEVSADTTQSAEISSDFSESEVLDLIAEVEDLTKALETVKQQVVELQTQCDKLTAERDKLADEIATRPSSTDAVKLMMEERLAAAKKARQS